MIEAGREEFYRLFVVAVFLVVVWVGDKDAITQS
jgi:hypothetical protein